MDKFQFIKTEIEDLFIVDVTKYGDERGYFMETYNHELFIKAGHNYNFVQDNQSCSKKGVLRGLHFQINHPQAKLIRVLDGEIFDVAVDLRKNSKTYGKYAGVILSRDNNRQFLIPKGFAHGFLVLSEMATIAYKCDDYYHPEDEGGIIWNDPDIGIEWPPITDPILSEKDSKMKRLNEQEVPF